MKFFETDTFIPAQKEGKDLDLEYSLTKSTILGARTLYKTALKRLLCPYLWHELAGSATAEFNIYESGRNNSKPVEVYDHLFIDIPGMSLESHDWVIVEEIKQQAIKQADESIGIKLRACPDPHTSEDTVSHFFTESATSTLIIKRIGNVVTASYHGRNEKPNIQTGNTLDNIRNGMVALGAMMGLSKLQWTALIKGLLSE